MTAMQMLLLIGAVVTAWALFGAACLWRDRRATSGMAPTEGMSND